MTRGLTYPDWAAKKRSEINRLGASVNWRRDEHPNPPTPHPESAPVRTAEPARPSSITTEGAGPFPTGRKVAQPNYAALGLGSAEEAEGRN